MSELRPKLTVREAVELLRLGLDGERSSVCRGLGWCVSMVASGRRHWTAKAAAPH